MKQPPRQRPVKDERDQLIDSTARNTSLEWMTAFTQILTVLCLVKGSTAWKGSLSLLFFGAAAGLLHKYKAYAEKPYLYVGLAMGAIGAALLVWYGLTG